jgi:hypothetical protein
MKIDSPTARQFIADEIKAVLDRHRLPRDSPIRKDLESRAEIGEGRNQTLVIRDDSNCLVMPDHWIERCKNNPHCRGWFPPELPKVPRHDLEKLRDHFYEILNDKMSVE